MILRIQKGSFLYNFLLYLTQIARYYCQNRKNSPKEQLFLN